MACLRGLRYRKHTISILLKDHDNVKDLFEKFENADSAAEKENLLTVPLLDRKDELQEDGIPPDEEHCALRQRKVIFNGVDQSAKLAGSPEVLDHHQIVDPVIHLRKQRIAAIR